MTFDAEHSDRPSEPGVEERLLDVLDELEVPATFFAQARWVEAYPSTARRLASSHLVGSHSHYHCRMPLLSDAGVKSDLHSAELVLKRFLKLDPKPWFRCPFGAGASDPRVLSLLEERGYVNVGWDVSAEDWKPARTVVGMVRDVVGRASSQDGAIVLMHAWPVVTLKAMPRIVSGLRAMKAAFVRVDELPFPPRASVPS